TGQKPENQRDAQHKLGSGSGRGGARQASAEHSVKRGAREGRCPFSWLVREELSCQILDSSLASAGRFAVLPRTLEDTERICMNRLLKRGDALPKCRQRRRAGNRRWRRGGAGARATAGGFSQLNLEQHPARELEAAQAAAPASIRARQEFASSWDIPISPAACLSFLTRRLEQADPLDPWLSRLLLICSPRFGNCVIYQLCYGLPSSCTSHQWTQQQNDQDHQQEYSAAGHGGAELSEEARRKMEDRRGETKQIVSQKVPGKQEVQGDQNEDRELS
uniref:DEAD/DEAH box helicase domain-containing protein n=1 Tax=Macrostomum lignano TaxID=282301 RepID=A0A1I8FPX9_9PLAT